MASSENIWQYSTVHNSAFKVIEEQALWGQTVCRVWLPNQNAVVRVPRSALRSLSADLQPEIEAGQELFYALQQAHLASVNREEERGMVAFTSRRKAIERVGLPEVRQYRLARCDAEETEWRHELQSARQIVPEIRSLLMLRIIKGGAQ